MKNPKIILTKPTPWLTSKHPISEWLTNTDIENALLGFSIDVLENLEGKYLVEFLFKIKNTEDSYKTVGFKQEIYYDSVNFSNLSDAYENSEIKNLLKICEGGWVTISDNYTVWDVNAIVFNYKITPISVVKELHKDKVIKTTLIDAPENAEFKKESTNTYGGYNLPLTMDFTKWGVCTMSSDYSSAIVKQVSRNSTYTKVEYHIKINDLHTEVEFKYSGQTVFTFVDTLKLENNIISNSTNYFKRTIKELTYYYEDGIRILIKSERKTPFILPVKPSYFRSEKFMTYDLETKLINGEMIPYCASIYDGKTFKTFYITDYTESSNPIEQSKLLLTDSINYLLKPKYSGFKVYVHNFSFFDGIFLMKTFSELPDVVVKPLIRDGRFIETKIHYGLKTKKEKINIELEEENGFRLVGESENIDVKKEKEIEPSELYTNIMKEISKRAKQCNHNIAFRDSYLLLTSKLSKLATTFGVGEKDLFPYKFVNKKNIGFDYVGKCPKYKHFNKTDIDLKDYQQYNKRFRNTEWDLKKETIKYCERDVKVLYDIIDKFGAIVFKDFNVDIIKTPTVSSLAFTIYRAKYLPKVEAKIPVLTGKIYEDIKKGFTGGSVDVYKPYGENIKQNIYTILFVKLYNIFVYLIILFLLIVLLYFVRLIILILQQVCTPFPNDHLIYQILNYFLDLNIIKLEGTEVAVEWVNVKSRDLKFISPNLLREDWVQVVEIFQHTELN